MIAALYIFDQREMSLKGQVDQWCCFGLLVKLLEKKWLWILPHGCEKSKEDKKNICIFKNGLYQKIRRTKYNKNRWL